jgi:hypothetical protein
MRAGGSDLFEWFYTPGIPAMALFEYMSRR